MGLNMYNHLTLHPTMRCNLSCVNCQTKGTVSKKAKDWAHEEFTLMMCKLYSLGLQFKTVTFVGGEPSLWPHLMSACWEVKHMGLCDNIQIITNGTTDDLECYRNADVIRVTDYGATNRWYIHRLKKRYKKKVHVSPNIHVPLPMPYTEEVSCSLFHLGILNGKMYKCCTQALHDIDGYPIDGPYILEYLHGPLPNQQEICKTCMGNKNAYEKVAVPMTVSIQTWGVEELSWIFRISLPTKKLRVLYQKLRNARGR